MEKLKIRRMEPQDVPQAAAIEKENFSLPWTEKSFLEAIEKKETIYLAALEGEQVVGYAGMWTVLDEGEITQVSVRKECQGRHIGKMLMTVLEEEGKRAGVTAFFLEVRKSNRPAIRLYENCGFSVQGTRKDFYENPKEDGLLMGKRTASLC